MALFRVAIYTRHSTTPRSTQQALAHCVGDQVCDAQLFYGAARASGRPKLANALAKKGRDKRQALPGRSQAPTPSAEKIEYRERTKRQWRVPVLW